METTISQVFFQFAQHEFISIEYFIVSILV